MTLTTKKSQYELTSALAPLVVVSCDSHVGPSLAQMREYCPAILRQDYDAFSADIGEKFDIWADVRKVLRDLPDRAEAEAREHEIDRNLQTAGHNDMDARRVDMDRDGVAADVIYHSSQNGQPIPFIEGGSLFFNPTGSDLEKAAAGIHIYNHWLADACATAPERHTGVVHLPAWDIDACVREVEWARGVGLRAVNLPTPRPGIRIYDDPLWERFWCACESLHMSLNTHVGGAGGDIEFVGNHAQAMLYVDRSGWLSRRALPRLLFSGVFERHPDLRFVLTEQNGEWWRATMREYDSVYRTCEWQLKDQMPKKPSEYCATNVYIGGSYMAPFEAEMAIDEGYVQNIMWGSDYPHAEGTYQYPEVADSETMTHVALRFTFSGIDPAATKAMLGDNAIRCYELDESALQEVAARISAPTAAELSEPPDTLPDITASMAFRTVGPWG